MIFALDDTHNFPPPHLAEPDGLLAIGGDLSPERLLCAYRLGIFPWYDKPPILWWSPSPRFVLFPDELKISKTLRPLLRRDAFVFSINKAFREVMQHCKDVPRNGQQGTWINDAIIDSYTTLHRMGFANSAEVWQNGELVGGLYGVRMGKVFFGESMFSLVSNASRYAFTKYIQQTNPVLVDCQVHSAYLESMGARMIEGSDFSALLKENLSDTQSINEI
ncbi:MAG: leucyl/phenylalanyl-tRNA--protein transferase [Niabella sp.]